MLIELGTKHEVVQRDMETVKGDLNKKYLINLYR